MDLMFHLSHRLRSKLRSPLGQKCAGQANLDLYSASQCDTPMAAKMTPLELVDLLNEVFQCFDGLVERYDLEKIKTIGDCYMVASGCRAPGPITPLRLSTSRSTRDATMQPLSIKNNTGGAVTVRAECGVFRNGKLIDTDQVTVENLDAGQTGFRTAGAFATLTPPRAPIGVRRRTDRSACLPRGQ